MKPTHTYAIDRELIADRIVENEAVILNLDNGMYYSLNEIGTRVWQMVDTGKSSADIVKTLLQEYSVKPEILEKDVEAIITELLQEKLIKKSRGKA